MAKGFVANGSTVHLIGRRKEKLDEAAKLLETCKANEAAVNTYDIPLRAACK